MDPFQIPPPASAEALAAFRSAADVITQDTVRRALAYPDEVAQHGEEAPRLLSQGLFFVTKGLETALAFHTVELLADQMRWAMDRLPHHDVEANQVLHRLHLYKESVADHLSAAHAAEVNAYVDWMIDYQRRLLSETS